MQSNGAINIFFCIHYQNSQYRPRHGEWQLGTTERDRHETQVHVPTVHVHQVSSEKIPFLAVPLFRTEYEKERKKERKRKRKRKREREREGGRRRRK